MSISGERSDDSHGPAAPRRTTQLGLIQRLTAMQETQLRQFLIGQIQNLPSLVGQCHAVSGDFARLLNSSDSDAGPSPVPGKVSYLGVVYFETHDPSSVWEHVAVLLTPSDGSGEVVIDGTWTQVVPDYDRGAQVAGMPDNPLVNFEHDTTVYQTNKIFIGSRPEWLAFKKSLHKDYVHLAVREYSTYSSMDWNQAVEAEHWTQVLEKEHILKTVADWAGGD